MEVSLQLYGIKTIIRTHATIVPALTMNQVMHKML